MYGLQTITEAWDAYQAAKFQGAVDVPEEEREYARRVFYAGAIAMVASVGSLPSSPLPDWVKSRFAQRLEQEMQQHMDGLQREVDAGRIVPR